jgi:PAS domain-containing protein
MPQLEVELILARKLAEAIAVAVLLTDDRGDTLFFNEAAGRILGRPFEEVEALPFEERTRLLAPLRADGSPLPADELPGVSAMRERRPAYVAFHMHDVEGHLRFIETTAIPLESSGGHVVGALVVAWTPTSGPSDPTHQPHLDPGS